MKNVLQYSLAVTLAGATSVGVYADSSHTVVKPEGHAPIGVMGDHLHRSGEFMVSYRLMHMKMSGNIQGSKSISNDTIATSVANPFANPPMSPPTVRVVPQDMTSTMHMFGMMYAPSDDLTLMAMLNMIEKNMDLTTYQGGMGTNTIGDFSTKSSGLADSKLGMLYRLHQQGNHQWHLNLNWLIPTGSIDEKDTALTPMNMRMEMRLPYGMQLGTGSHGIDIGLTYNGYAARMNWGLQVISTHFLSENDNNYTWGDTLNLTSWLSYRISNTASMSARLQYLHQNELDGMDKNIMAPVTTANPMNYGGNKLNIAFGLNTVLANKHRVAFEYLVPVEEDLNGVQMAMDHMFNLGYQLAF